MGVQTSNKKIEKDEALVCGGMGQILAVLGPDERLLSRDSGSDVHTGNKDLAPWEPVHPSGRMVLDIQDGDMEAIGAKDVF